MDSSGHGPPTSVPHAPWTMCLLWENVSGELALTNFDTHRLEEITSKGIPISSNQVNTHTDTHTRIPHLHTHTCNNTPHTH